MTLSPPGELCGFSGVIHPLGRWFPAALLHHTTPQLPGGPSTQEAYRPNQTESGQGTNLTLSERLSKETCKGSSDREPGHVELSGPTEARQDALEAPSVLLSLTTRCHQSQDLKANPSRRGFNVTNLHSMGLSFSSVSIHREYNVSITAVYVCTDDLET